MKKCLSDSSLHRMELDEERSQYGGQDADQPDWETGDPVWAGHLSASRRRSAARRRLKRGPVLIDLVDSEEERPILIDLADSSLDSLYDSSDEPEPPKK